MVLDPFVAPLGAPENFYTFYYSLASFSFILRAIWTSKMIKFKGVSIDSDPQNPKIFRLRRANKLKNPPLETNLHEIRGGFLKRGDS